MNENFNLNLQRVFNAVDRDEGKTIKIEELPKALRAAGLNPTEAQIEELSNNCVLISEKFLDFKEFQKVAYSCKEFFRVGKDEVVQYFEAFDKEKMGFLTVEELKSALCESGDKLSKNEVEVIIRDFDKDGSGRIRISLLVEGLFSGCFNE
jgi:calmodulin